MSQTQQTASAQQAQNLNQTSIITYFKCDDVTICIVSIVSPDGKTRLFGNGIGTIVLMNHITRKGDTQTPPENQKQYALHFENGKWNCYLDGNLIYTFDEIFGLPEGNSSLGNVSFQQFKYVPTAVDERTMQFREILGQLVSAYPDRFCFEDPAKQKTAHLGGINASILNLFICFKKYFDCLKKEIKIPRPFIDTLACRSEVCSHLKCDLLKNIFDELMIPLYSLSQMRNESIMTMKVYEELLEHFEPAIIIVSQFQSFCVERFGLVGDYKSYVVGLLNKQIFGEYDFQIGSLSPDLSPEEHKKKRGEIYASAILNIEKLCLELVQQWTSFHNSNVNWRDEGILEFHIPSQTYHETSRSDWRPYYLGTSILEGTNVHVFMDGESGKVFTMAI